VENVAGVKKKSKRKESRYGRRYGLELKLRCVELRLEGPHHQHCIWSDETAKNRFDTGPMALYEISQKRQGIR
jgi:ribosomal protein L37AE/L43A